MSDNLTDGTILQFISGEDSGRLTRFLAGINDTAVRLFYEQKFLTKYCDTCKTIYRTSEDGLVCPRCREYPERRIKP